LRIKKDYALTKSYNAIVIAVYHRPFWARPGIDP